MARNPWVLPDGFDADTRKAIRALVSALKKSGANIPQDAYTQLRLGNIDAFLSYVDWEKIRSGFGDFESVLRAAAQRNGKSTFTLGGVENELLFDLIDERAVIYARERVGQLIVEITDQMREVVRETIASAEMGQFTYQQAAIRLQSTIPLTSRDAGAVDKFIDKKFQKFMRDGLSEARARIKAQDMGAKYAAKLLESRTRTIARTEIIDASMSGRYIGWEAGVTAGQISNDSVKEWIAEPDACPICRELDGKIISWNDEWQFPEGVTAGSTNRMPPAHPNCRCSVVILPPDYEENIFTPQSGGEMPESAEEFMKSIAPSDFRNDMIGIAKHLPGKHDQSTHGRGGTRSVSTDSYDDLRSEVSQQYDATRGATIVSYPKYEAAVGELRNLDGSTLSPESQDFGKSRYLFRSAPMPEGQFEAEFDTLQKDATKFIKDNPVTVVVPEEVVPDILAEGRIKTIYDMPDAKGEDYVEHRLVYERVAFGYDNSLPIDQRPVSGAVFPDKSRREAFDQFGENYGSVQVVLKDSVKSRTTYTLGDSLDTFQKPIKIGDTIPRTFDTANAAGNAANYRKRTNSSLFDNPQWQARNYFEAQVHGGVRVSDISKIIFTFPVDTVPTQQLNSLGIDFEVIDD